MGTPNLLNVHVLLRILLQELLSEFRNELEAFKSDIVAGGIFLNVRSPDVCNVVLVCWQLYGTKFLMH